MMEIQSMNSRFSPFTQPIFQNKREGEAGLVAASGTSTAGGRMTAKQTAMAAADSGVVRLLGRGAGRGCMG